MTASPPPDSSTLQTALQAALRAWNNPNTPPETALQRLVLVRDQLAGQDAAGDPTARAAIRQTMLAALDALTTLDPHGAKVLRLRYLDAQMTKEVARQLKLSVDQINRQQRAALQRLTEIVIAREQAARQARLRKWEEALPAPPDHPLFGVDAVCQQLEQQLLHPDAPWLVLIAGLGGIGKTVLADALARRILRQFHFEQIVWLRVTPGQPAASGPSAEAAFEALILSLTEALWPQGLEMISPAALFNRVREALRAQAYLVIIDNLESEGDTAYLLEQLPGFTRPSKFVLTTRSRPPALGSAAFAVSLGELSLDEAAALLRHQAALTGLADLSAVSETDAEAVYRRVGGNPLALKLVVSLGAVQPLGQILKDLEHLHPGAIEDLYRHIYWKAWQALSPPARTLLRAMPLVAEPGALPEHLHAISGLSDSELWPAITELWSRSLLEVRGTLHEKRYGIHRLTETFLRTEIIHWPE